MAKSAEDILKTPIEFLKGVGPQKADLLKKDLNIFNYGDLLSFYPYRYIDRTKITSVSELNLSTPYVQLKGTVTGFQLIPQKRGKRLVAKFQDSTGQVELVWFQGVNWVKDNFKAGVEYLIFGKPNIFRGKVSIVHPEMDLATASALNKKASLQPLYSSTEKLKKRGLDTKGISRLTTQLMQELKPVFFEENLPGHLVNRFKLPDRNTAMRQIHFPASNEALEGITRRLKFEEFFWIQLELIKLKLNRKEDFAGYVFEKIDNHFDRFYKDHLPFELTGAQKRVMREVRADLKIGKQMNRLLQGDVGSGKTIVALMCMLMALDNGFQACIMAPTEILAQQHLDSIREFVKDLPINVSLLTGSITGKTRKQLLTALEIGEIHILVGTHALIEDKVKFQNLGLAVIDEQHRFGVAQRAKLWKKNTLPPHILVMTATPIPRTLAMTVYGDLDVSVIDELPPGRKPIVTVIRNDGDRLKVFGFMRDEIKKGRQIYVIYPLIDESEKLDYKDLMDGYESICRAFPLPEYRVSIVHGRMKAENKDHEMDLFVRAETQIMVATTVIEVGVNVPNASVMVIESSERFGLSQLHQLRGRVGRGAEQSFCILMTGEKVGHEARQRLKILTDTNDGFRIAEADLKIRGPGDIQGTRQSGDLNLKISDVVKDNHILQLARKEAMNILENDPALQKPENENIRRYLLKNRSETTAWSRIS